jgi:hypothetical protein
MSTATMRDYPALGFDPAPGATERVGALATDLGSVATELGAAQQALTSIGCSSGIWQGEAAEAFHDKLGEVPDYLGKAHRSLSDAARTLDQWSADLTSMQTAAAQYEAEAAQALRRLQSAESNPDLGLVGHTFPDEASLAQAQARYDAATAQLNIASKELEAIRELAQRLLVQHDELVSEVADALRRAKDEAPKEPGFFDRLISDLADGIKNLASATWKWVQDHADVIAQFGDIMSKISTALAVLAIVTAPFEPVGAIFAGAAAGTALMALGAHGLAKAAGAKIGWGTIGADALGALPFVGGAARGAKIATSAERALGAASEDVLSYGASRAAGIGGGVVKTSVKTSNGVTKAYSMISAEGVAGRLDTGIEAAYQGYREGQYIGTKGLNMVAEKLTKEGIIDPLSVGGRALDAGIKGGKSIAGEVYHQLTGPGDPPPSASQTFSSRVTARGGV